MSHFGHPRVPKNLDELQAFEVSAAALKAMATDAFDVLEASLRGWRPMPAAEPRSPLSVSVRSCFGTS